MTTYWAGDAPARCDTCDEPIRFTFYDAKTKSGAWGFLCPTCHNLGPGLGKLGTGWGQEYVKLTNGKWVKTAG
jgi:hypothetical protein